MPLDEAERRLHVNSDHLVFEKITSQIGEDALRAAKTIGA